VCVFISFARSYVAARTQELAAMAFYGASVAMEWGGSFWAGAFALPLVLILGSTLRSRPGGLSRPGWQCAKIALDSDGRVDSEDARKYPRHGQRLLHAHTLRFVSALYCRSARQGTCSARPIVRECAYDCKRCGRLLLRVRYAALIGPAARLPAHSLARAAVDPRRCAVMIPETSGQDRHCGSVCVCCGILKRQVGIVAVDPFVCVVVNAETSIAAVDPYMRVVVSPDTSGRDCLCGPVCVLW
jgi:hypothetical protein